MYALILQQSPEEEEFTIVKVYLRYIFKEYNYILYAQMTSKRIVRIKSSEM